MVKPATGFFSVTSARGRLEWDGASLSYKVGLQRRELVRIGEGALLRATFAGPQLHSRGPRLLWVGPDGRERADLDERQWPIDEVLHVAALARVPVVPLGTLTHRELYDHYPAMAPTIGGLDPQTPMTWGALGHLARSGVHGVGRSPRDRFRLMASGAVVALTGVWLALRALGIVG